MAGDVFYFAKPEISPDLGSVKTRPGSRFLCRQKYLISSDYPSCFFTFSKPGTSWQICTQYSPPKSKKPRRETGHGRLLRTLPPSASVGLSARFDRQLLRPQRVVSGWNRSHRAACLSAMANNSRAGRRVRPGGLLLCSGRRKASPENLFEPRLELELQSELNQALG